MFIGEYSHNIDTKGRIVIPAKFRDELVGDNNLSFVVTRGLDGCLTIYSYTQWEQLLTQLSKLPNTKKLARQYSRMLASNAFECSLDNQGRIQIPSNLTKPVNITKNCVVVGNVDHVEIWDKQTWEDYINDASESFEDIAENLGDLLDNE